MLSFGENDLANGVCTCVCVFFNFVLVAVLLSVISVDVSPFLFIYY